MVFCVGDSLRVEVTGSFKNVEFDDVYRIDKRLNAGFYGTVYKATLKSNRSESYAVKVIDKTECEGDDRSVLYEANMLRDINHLPNIVRLVDLFMTKDKMYMVQTLAEGGDACDRIVEKETYMEHDARTFGRVLLRTVQSLHERNIVHRDLKPENILLKSKHDDTDILLCDFGHAKYMPKEKNKGLVTLCGTPEFAAPELLEGTEYGAEVDVWSIGCILFMLLGGYLPFGGDDYDELADKITTGDYDFDDETWDVVSDNAKQMISNLLVPDRKYRWSVAQALDCDWFRDVAISHDDRIQSEQRRAIGGVEPGNLCQTQARISKYVARRKLKAAVHVVELSQRISLACGTNGKNGSSLWDAVSKFENSNFEEMEGDLPECVDQQFDLSSYTLSTTRSIVFSQTLSN